MINANELIESARGFIGKLSYSFGSENIDGGTGDCSAFTQYIFKLYGVNIGRDTQSQYTGVEKITKENLQTGDLVFFKNTYASKNTDGVSHVGIYSGNGNFIHLGSSGCKESSLSSAFWSEHWLSGGRVTGVVGSGDTTTTTGGSTTTTDISTVWWGDVVVVVVIVLLILAGVISLGLSVGIGNKFMKIGG